MTGAKKVVNKKNQFFHARQPREEIFDVCSHLHCIFTISCFFTALAFDPLQKIMAIGNRSGKIRLYGRPGVDVEFQHQKEVAVFKIIFVVNTGRLLTATTGKSLLESWGTTFLPDWQPPLIFV